MSKTKQYFQVSMEEVEEQIKELLEPEDLEVLEADDLASAVQQQADASREVELAQEAMQSVVELNNQVTALQEAVTASANEEGEVSQEALRMATVAIHAALEQYGLDKHVSLESVDSLESLNVSLEGILGDFFRGIGRALSRLGTRLKKFLGATFAAVKSMRKEAQEIINDAEGLEGKSAAKEVKLPGSAKWAFASSDKSFGDAAGSIRALVDYSTKTTAVFNKEFVEYGNAVTAAMKEYGKIFEESGRTFKEYVFDYTGRGARLGFFAGLVLGIFVLPIIGFTAIVGALQGAYWGFLLGVGVGVIKGKSSDDPRIQARVKRMNQIQSDLRKKFEKFAKSIDSQVRSGKNLPGQLSYTYLEFNVINEDTVVPAHITRLSAETAAPRVAMPGKSDIVALAKAVMGTGVFEQKYKDLLADVERIDNRTAEASQNNAGVSSFWRGYKAPIIGFDATLPLYDDTLRAALGALAACRAAIKQY